MIKDKDYFRSLINSFFPNTRIWEDRFCEGSILYRIVGFMADVLAKNVRDDQDVIDGYLLLEDNTTLLTLLEREYGLPDNIFIIEENIQDRLQILSAKIFLAEVGVSSISDYLYLASFFGIDKIQIRSARELKEYSLDASLDLILFDDTGLEPFYFIIFLPKELNPVESVGGSLFDVTLDAELIGRQQIVSFSRFQLLIQRLKPSYVQIEYRFTL